METIKYIRHIVFPLVTLKEINGRKTFNEFLGSAFFIGERGYAITAAHVIESVKEQIWGIYPVDGETKGYKVIEKEINPDNDVAIIRLEDKYPISPFIIKTDRYEWKDYEFFGYPEYILFEDINKKTINDTVIPQFDIINAKGYIRRIVQRELSEIRKHVVKGKIFYELNEVTGWGTSGSPIFNRKSEYDWELYGIYVAQKINYVENDDEVKFIDYAVGYAVPSFLIASWIPDILKISISKETSWEFRIPE